MSEILDTARGRMEKSLEALRANFANIRTGRPNPHILDSIEVDAYGSMMNITALAGVRVSEGTMLLVEPYDKSILNAIEKAISQSDLGITPSNDGVVIRLPFPKPTGERRKQLAKDCKACGEEAKVAVRNVRREANAKLERDEELSEDDVRREQAKVQKLTDEFVKKIDEATKAKEAEIMEI